jgi:hypothetical protein
MIVMMMAITPSLKASSRFFPCGDFNGAGDGVHPKVAVAASETFLFPLQKSHANGTIFSHAVSIICVSSCDSKVVCPSQFCWRPQLGTVPEAPSATAPK